MGILINLLQARRLIPGAETLPLEQAVFFPGVTTSGTVASEKDGFMSETMIYHRNLPNPHLFEPLFCTRA
jgi:hypothetical protein